MGDLKQLKMNIELAETLTKLTLELEKVVLEKEKYRSALLELENLYPETPAMYQDARRIVMKALDGE